jgi:hypothetical protein
MTRLNDLISLLAHPSNLPINDRLVRSIQSTMRGLYRAQSWLTAIALSACSAKAAWVKSIAPMI